MKKVLVVVFTGFAVLVLFFMAAGSRRFAASADALAGEENVLGLRRQEGMMKESLRSFGGEGRNAAAPSAAPPTAPEPLMNALMGDAQPLGDVGSSAEGLSGGGSAPGGLKRGAMPKMREARSARADVASAEAVEAPAATRAWFPETFLFEPLVVTDANGRASVPVKVPDRLTTWRVLALAHSRQGAQAGAVTSFLGTLPTYVEPVTPPALYAGDRVTLPIQVVNTTEKDVTSPLRLESTGVLSSTGGSVRVAAQSNVVQSVSLTAPRPGPLTFKATLGSTDAVERVIDVQPAGQRQVITHGGTLAAARSFPLEGPADALPNSERVALRVFPGALGLVRSELSAAPGRGGVAEDAYLLQLLGDAPALLTALGQAPDLPTIRTLSLLATQRVMRHARSPSVDAATLLAEAALAHPDNPVLARLGERLAQQVAQAQRPDGTCQGATGWTLQRLLVTTGGCLRAVKAAQGAPSGRQRFTAVSVKAAGAFERNLGRIADPYTAASVLASGAVSGSVADALKVLVLKGIKPGVDGASFLAVPSGVVRADGLVPSTIEATALAVLALEGDAQAPLADLGTTLLGAYSPFTGWGDGRTNLLALRAITRLFKDKVPPGVTITLERDGKALTQGTLTPETLTQVLVLEADASGSGGAHTWSVKAEPQVPGLGYTVNLVAFVPWKESDRGGLELTQTLPKELKVGRGADLALTAAYPSGTAMTLRLGLPAGVQSDTAALDALVAKSSITRYETEDGAITLHLPQLPNGEVWEATVRVIPTLAGTLQAQPTTLSVDVQPAGSKARGPKPGSRAFVPKAWVITAG